MQRLSMLVLFLGALLALQEAAVGADEFEVEVLRDLAYVEGDDVDDRQKLDLYVPKGDGPWPVLLWVHGGAWAVGHRKQEEALARRFAERGIAVASADHRMSKALWIKPELDTGVEHPVHVEDVAAAFAWLVRNAPAHRLDGQRMFAGGFSSGAHLTALLATDPKYLKAHGIEMSTLKGALPVGGAYDMEAYYEAHLEANGETMAEQHVLDVFGRAEGALKDASPLTHVKQTDVPMLVLSEKNTHGYTLLFEDAVAEAGIDRIRFRHFLDRTHASIGKLMAQEGPDEARDAMVAFILDPCAPSPAERFAAATKTFPEPDHMNAFSFRGRITSDGKDIGTMTLKASGAERDGKGVWIVSERVALHDGGYALTTATLDATLRPVTGRIKYGTRGQPSYEVAWRSEDGTWVLEGTGMRGGEVVLQPPQPVVDGSLTTTATALCLFARFVLPAEGAYEAQVLRPAKGDFGRCRLALSNEAKWQGQPAWSLTEHRDGVERRTFFFDPDTLSLLGLHDPSPGFADRQPQVVEAAAQPPVELDRPATSVVEGALQAALALAAPDLDLLERVVHWPSLYEEARAVHVAEHEGETDVPPFMDPVAFKADRLAYVKRSFKERPRGLLATALKASRNHLELEDLDTGEVQVTLPALFRSLVVVVKEVDGVWLLSRMPEKPR